MFLLAESKYYNIDTNTESSVDNGRRLCAQFHWSCQSGAPYSGYVKIFYKFHCSNIITHEYNM